MNTKLGKRGSKATRNQNSAGCQFKLGFFLVGLAVLIRLAHPTAAFASETDNGPGITVLVFNFRAAPAETLVKAEKEAGRILEQAGVHVTWRDCPTGNEPCRKGPGRVFFLAMMAGPVRNKVVDTVSGYAFLPDHLAVVYYDYLPPMPGRENGGRHRLDPGLRHCSRIRPFVARGPQTFLYRNNAGTLGSRSDAARTHVRAALSA